MCPLVTNAMTQPTSRKRASRKPVSLFATGRKYTGNKGTSVQGEESSLTYSERLLLLCGLLANTCALKNLLSMIIGCSTDSTERSFASLAASLDHAKWIRHGHLIALSERSDETRAPPAVPHELKFERCSLLPEAATENARRSTGETG